MEEQDRELTKLASRRQIAEAYGISEQAIRRWERQEFAWTPKPVRLMGSVRYRVADVEAWLAAQDDGR